MMTVWPRYSVPAGPDAERPGREVDPVHVHVEDAGPEPLGLGAERGHQVRALDPVREARVVLDVAREHQLAAGGGAGDDDRREVGPGGVDRRGEAGRPGTDDDDRRFACGPDDGAVRARPGRCAAGAPNAIGALAKEIGVAAAAAARAAGASPKSIAMLGVLVVSDRSVMRVHPSTSAILLGSIRRRRQAGHRSQVAELRDDRRADGLDRARVDGVRAHDDVLDAGVGQVAEAVDEAGSARSPRGRPRA